MFQFLSDYSMSSGLECSPPRDFGSIESEIVSVELKYHLLSCLLFNVFLAV